MNAKAHDTIGMSPAELLYGKAINLYTGLLLPFPPESLVKGQEEAVNGRLSDHIAKLIAMQTLYAIKIENGLGKIGSYIRYSRLRGLTSHL